MHTVRAVAARYGVTIMTVGNWIATDQLTALNVGRSPRKKKPRWRITDEALAEFERRRSTGTLVAPTVRQARRARKQKAAEVIEFYH